MRQFMTATTQQQIHQTTSTRYIPIPKWGQYHEWPSIGGLRHLVFHKNTNGFATAFKKVGRIILIDEVEFFAFIERKNQGGAK
jgi:hypothetical protein